MSISFQMNDLKTTALYCCQNESSCFELDHLNTELHQFSSPKKIVHDPQVNNMKTFIVERCNFLPKTMFHLHKTNSAVLLFELYWQPPSGRKVDRFTSETWRERRTADSLSGYFNEILCNFTSSFHLFLFLFFYELNYINWFMRRCIKWPLYCDELHSIDGSFDGNNANWRTLRQILLVVQLYLE